MIRRRREPEPPDQNAALLAVLGATGQVPAPAFGCWVYGLRDASGETFYIGKSENLLTRLGHWHKTYGDALASVWLVRCASEWQMQVTEDFLIDRFQPRMNVHGMSDEETRIRERIMTRSRRIRSVHAALAEAGVPSGRGGGYKAVSGELWDSLTCISATAAGDLARGACSWPPSRWLLSAGSAHLPCPAWSRRWRTCCTGSPGCSAARLSSARSRSS